MISDTPSLLNTLWEELPEADFLIYILDLV